MMDIGGRAHILMIVASVIIGVALFFIVKKVKPKVQNIIIYTLTGICMFGIFFLHGTKYFTTFDIGGLLTQMLQVCNFNFILLPLALFKKNEIVRQYLFYFSMPMALSTFVSYPSDVEGSMWYSVVCLTFWINHFLIALLPFLYIATKKFKPRTNYVWKVALCVIAYFLIAFLGNFILNGFAINGPHNHSYTMSSGSIMLLVPLFKLIPIPFVYLLPVIVLLYFIWWGISAMFKNYNVQDNFGIEFKNKKLKEGESL